MPLVLASLCLFLVAAILAPVFFKRPRLAALLGAGGAFGSSLLGLAGAASSLLAPAESVDLALAIPLGRFSLNLDPLSAFFLLPLYVLTAAVLFILYPFMVWFGKYRARNRDKKWLSYL